MRLTRVMPEENLKRARPGDADRHPALPASPEMSGSLKSHRDSLHLVPWAETGIRCTDG